MDAHDTFPASTSLSLMLAVVTASETPLLLLTGDLTVVAASSSFCAAFAVDPATLPGKSVLAMGNGEWNVPQLGSLLRATASGAAEVHAYELDLHRPGQSVRHLVINAHRLDYEDKVHVRLLLAVADVTAARASEKLKDDLIRDKAVLLREVQHRIANSLQIIASVLLQSARRVQSEETRGHLKDAHSRVMSIAAVQRQLAQSAEGEVALAPYLKQLCASLAASMIEDPARLAIRVFVDDSIVPSDTSISIGLIVTELVINALKHAFPDGRSGKITVRYQAFADDWSLSVGDDGIGMPRTSEAKPGLGTSIVEALATQMEAKVQLADVAEGTRIEVVHSGAPAPDDAAPRAV
jgi:two-component system, sensor histidine kinase PdtaS